MADLTQIEPENSTMMENETATEQTLEGTVKVLAGNLDAFFLIVMGIVVFLMQCGFAFLEAGSVRSKNTVNIIIKNMLDAFIGGVTYWAIGWALAYGPHGNEFVGGSNFFSYQIDMAKYPLWFFQFVFAATAATIVSGSIAERCQFFAYFCYSIVITGWVYPVVSHWAWDSSGWLSQRGYHDFAGSGVVHLLGATCALVGCFLIKPRKGRFTKQGIPIEMQGHSVPLAALGGFILLFGFLAFNGGSQLSISNPQDPEIVGLVIVNTIIGGCSGGLSVLFLNRLFFGGKWSYLLTLNGALAGMVSQCAGCDGFMPWAALVVGMFGGLAFFGTHEIMLKCKLDDPLDAVGVHGGGGIVGIICQPFFVFGSGIFWVGDTLDPWYQLGINVAGAVSIIAWSGFWSLLLFGTLHYFDLLRIDRDTEFRGNDIVKHGEPAYPVEAWAELQYEDRKKSSVAAPWMSGSSRTTSTANNAFEMVPSAGKLFSSLGKNFNGFSGDNNDAERGQDNKAMTDQD